MSYCGNYKSRIAKPSDLVKQPVQDILRLLSAGLFKLATILVRRNKTIDVVLSYPLKLLVIRRNRLGDAISILPALQWLKNKHASIAIDVLATNYNRVIFQRSRAVSSVYLIPSNGFLRNYLSYFNPVIRKLRRKKYDLIVVASGAYSSQAAWLSFCVGAANRVGVVSVKGSILDLVYTTPVGASFLNNYSHQVQKIGALFEKAGFVDTVHNLLRPELIGQQEKATGAGCVVCLCPLVRRTISAWPDERWYELAIKLKESHVKYFWIGSAPQGHTAVETPTVEHFIDEMSKSSLVVCSEGGASHIAAGLDIPVVVLSGKGIKKLWAPWTSKAVLIECLGAISDIHPDEVMRQICSMLYDGAFVDGLNVSLPGEWLGASTVDDDTQKTLAHYTN